MNETGAYRISRYRLKGERSGTHDLFIDNLPGLPDNLSFNGRDRFWVALYSPRNALLDGFAGYPLLRKVMVRALMVVPKPIVHKAFVLGLDTDGKVIANLQDGSAGNYSPSQPPGNMATVVPGLTEKHEHGAPAVEAGAGS